MSERINGHHVLHTDLGYATPVVHIHTHVDRLDPTDLAAQLFTAGIVVLWGAMILFGSLDAPRAVGIALWGAMVLCLVAAVGCFVRGYRRRRAEQTPGEVTPS